MDGSRFDDLTRFMAETPSRRTVVKALVGALAGSLASVGTAIGAPRCKRVNQACQTTADCCPGPNANGNVYCKAISKKAKVCAACPAETPTACNGGCVNTNSDNLNCGTCGTVCHGTTTCVNGSCQCPAGQHLCADGSCQECCSDSHCTVPEVCCSGTCADLDSDDANCGTCGHVCPADHTCRNNGRCLCPVGQVEGANGICACGPVACLEISGEPLDSQCCDGWGCNADTGLCEACHANGTLVGSDKPNLCCSGTVYSGVCVNSCTSTSDCDPGTGQVCNADGVCGCQGGTISIDGDGACN